MDAKIIYMLIEMGVSENEINAAYAAFIEDYENETTLEDVV